MTVTRLFYNAITTAGEFFVTSLHYTQSFPESFVGLVDEDDDIRGWTIDLCKRAVEILDILEPLAWHGDEEVNLKCRAFLRDLIFPCEQWTMEIFTMLREHRFTEPWNWILDTELYQFLRRLCSTRLAENVIKTVRKTEK